MAQSSEWTMDRIVQVRKRSKAFLAFALVEVLIRLGIFAAVVWYGKSSSEIINTVNYSLATGSSVLTLLAYFTAAGALKDFYAAWGHFYNRRYLPLLKVYQQEGYTTPWSVSKIRFYRAPDLVNFERTLIDGLRAARVAIDRERRSQKWERMNRRLYSQFDAVCDEFGVYDRQRELLQQEFTAYENPRRRREWLDAIGVKLASERWKAQSTNLLNPASAKSTVVIEPPADEDIELRSMRVRAKCVASAEARALYAQAQGATNRREELRLLGAALRIEERRTDEDVQKRPSLVTREMPPAEVRQISLQEFTRERLTCFREIFGEKTEWQMCREIVLVLLEPGHGKARIGKHYLAEDTVKVTVRRRYQINVGAPFDPAVFEEAVEVMRAYGILFSKPKTDERTLSLMTRSAHPQGSRAIKAALALKRELGGFV